MRGVLQAIASLFGRRALSAEEQERLVKVHRERCLHFRLLLSANNRALEGMTTVEEALSGAKPFGMDFVRAQCTRISSEVWRMIASLNGLAPDRYTSLFDRHRAIQQRIELTLAAHGGADGPLVLPLSRVRASDAGEVGSKAATLGEVAAHLDVRVPGGFVVTSSGYRALLAENALQDEINRRIQASGEQDLEGLYVLSSSLQQLITASAPPKDLAEEIEAQVQALVREWGRGLRLAVRSSAVGEDLLGTSFAGQYRSELNVHPDDVVQVYKEIVASKYGAVAMAYRFNRGIRDEDVPMCVAVMPMSPCRASGVAYTRNPLDVRDAALAVHAVWGLPKAVVDGSSPADFYLLDRTPGGGFDVKVRNVADKRMEFVPSDEGLDRTLVPEQQRLAPCLDEGDLQRLATLAAGLERFFGHPQDLEWALEPDNGFTVLQVRPLRQEHAFLRGRSQSGDGAGCADRPLLEGGVTASLGVGAGRPVPVLRDADILSFPDGAVLVAAHALPSWAPLLSRASAVVTERGGAAGHLANVAREFGIPALMGCAGAVQALQGQDMVTVDADGGRIWPGLRKDLLALRARPRNLMAGSPVHESLRRAGEQIIPLTLRDPGAPEFRAENCSTLHDITRYCHEKAVAEMFAEDQGPALPWRTSKRLVCGVPMQYWIIDLDDGFTEPVRGRTVRLDQIASRPMLSLWQGMTAKAWAGPPAVDAKGFLSVVAGAASTPGLDPAAGSDFATRNYFMISKDFVSLQSRFGFHFSTVEAASGPDPAENYVSFRFKGGAADRTRREGRARLVGDILEGCGFRVEVAGDAVTARSEGIDHQETEHLLAILGYIIIHTRQIDMIMADAGKVRHIRRTILDDLATLPAPA